MSEAEVKIALRDGSFVLKKWEKHCPANLCDITETVKDVKQSLNDYLTELIECSSKDGVEIVDISDQEEEEEAECDGVSGFIKGVTIIKEKSSGCEKRKLNYSKRAKKLKK